MLGPDQKWIDFCIYNPHSTKKSFKCLVGVTNIYFIAPRAAFRAGKEVQYIEFFAGTANCFKSAHNSGIPSMAVDIAYYEASSGSHSGCQNPFDFLTPSGFVLLSLKPKII